VNKITFVLPIKITSKLSLNSIYGGIHWSERRKQAKHIHEIINLELISQKVPKKTFKNPVKIEFFWNSLLDLDNHGFLAKLIIDGLKGCLIRDDTKKYVQEITHAYWLGNGVKIAICDYGQNKRPNSREKI
jgi:hypothetical protein